MLSGARPPPVLAEREEPELAPDANDSERDLVIGAMGRTPVDIDAIIRFTGLMPATVRLILFELDIAGRLEHHPGGSASIVD